MTVSREAKQAEIPDSVNLDLVFALRAALGHLLNAKIDLETGTRKITALRTIDGGIKLVREALAKAGAS